MRSAQTTPPRQLITAVVQGTGVQAHVETPVPWWSFGKTVLASAALALVAQGRIQLDEMLRGKPFTLRQLLGHDKSTRAALTMAGCHRARAGAARMPLV